jgi:pimeloyl-ACP methyl ester carboxylesterase
MNGFPGWRYLRNLALLVVAAIGSQIGLFLATRSPLHLLWALVLFYLVYTLWGAFSFTHPRRKRYWLLGGITFASPGYEKALFQTPDGLTLFGWYHPGSNRAAVILAHGLGGTGWSMQGHAEGLLQAGYSVLLIDFRAHGSSDGHVSTYGVLEANDIVGAVAYLQGRPEIDPGKIGVLGVSLGAQAALRGALRSPAIAALALEGLGPADLQDAVRPAPVKARPGSPLWLWRRARLALAQFENWLYNFFSGQRPTSLKAEIGKLAPRPLLLIACGRSEIEFNRSLAELAGEHCQTWELPKASHGAALAIKPGEYARRVVGFFDRALE